MEGPFKWGALILKISGDICKLFPSILSSLSLFLIQSLLCFNSSGLVFFPLIFFLREAISRFFLSLSAWTALQSSSFLWRDYCFSGSVLHSILSSNHASSSVLSSLLLLFLLHTLQSRPATSTISHQRLSPGFSHINASGFFLRYSVSISSQRNISIFSHIYCFLKQTLPFCIKKNILM